MFLTLLYLKVADMRTQFWLLGYEFPATLILLTTETVYIVTTKKKGINELLDEGITLTGISTQLPIWNR